MDCISAGITLYATSSHSSPVAGQVGQALGNYIVESQNDPSSMANIFPTAALALSNLLIGSVIFGLTVVFGIIIVWFLYQILKKY